MQLQDLQLKKRFLLFCFNLLGLWTWSQPVSLVPVQGGGNCCCGEFVELVFPNLDFEEPPQPPPGGLILYSVGGFFSGWTCTRATIDHKDAFFGNLTLGNPNGRSNFIDLHGSPGFGAIEYNLTGLTPGNLYRIEFWTAQNGSGYSSTGTLKIAGGAWLNVNWTVNTDGSVFWFKETHFFMANAATAKMEFSSVGGSEWGGTLLDDITIFECPGDLEGPEVLNIPDDEEVECDKDVPKAPALNIADNCDPAPDVVFKERTEQIDPCNKIIHRSWEVKDDCGNITLVEQQIIVSDQTAPQFTRLPENQYVSCSSNLKKVFDDWIKKNGNAAATDACGKVTWRTTIDHEPMASCDSILVEFIAVDHCGQENSEFATFYIIDTTAPRLIKPAESKMFFCDPHARDSLRIWLASNGYAAAEEDCDSLIWSNNFNGDSTRKDIRVRFYARDLCGNIDSTEARFQSSQNRDTFYFSLFSCTASKDQSDTILFTRNGCDSMVITQTIAVRGDTNRTVMHTCDPKAGRIDTLVLKNRFGCDSLQLTEFIVHDVSMQRVQDFSCDHTGTFYDTLVLAGQYCDSIIITEHLPLRKDSIFVFQTTCDSLKQGTVIQRLANQFNCDSVVTIVTAYSPNTSTFRIVNECGLLQAYRDTMVFNTATCDSLVITDHLPVPVDSIYLAGRSCDPAKAGRSRILLKNQFGCDSIIVQDILLDPSDSLYLIKVSCRSSDAGLQRQLFANQYGCDSLVLTETLFQLTDSLVIDRFSCKANEAGTVRRMFSTANACDSLIITRTRYVKPDTSVLNQNTCNLNAQKSDTSIFQTAYCDSVVIRNIRFVPSDTVMQFRTSCLPSDTGVVRNTLVNRKGCDSLIILNTAYAPLRLQLQIDSIRCHNTNDGAIQILNTGIFQSPWELRFNGQILGNQSRIGSLQPGRYEISVRDARGCVTDSLQFDLINPEALITDLGSDQKVRKGTMVDLNLQSNRTLQRISWSPSGITSCSQCSQIRWSADRDLWIYALGFDDRGCSSLDSVFIQLLRDRYAYVPNAISANGDQINDAFYVIANEDSQVELLQIYDRWGELLFSRSNIEPNRPELGWDGSYNGQKMIPGAYVYLARVRDADGQLHILKGDFTLIR
ncbi:MAG TPA: gliding motility-associated C-terminal domain-containing protein [Saprospiraceae bacterium]|nr:gliding motility-associated C-terminal domain-containing protein [Saprospiraceae bacterium]